MVEHEKPSLRTKIYMIILKKSIFKRVFFIFEKLNHIVFHWDLRERTIKGSGENNNTYYVYRGAGKNDIAGLVGSYYLVGGVVYKALQLGQIPYVDFQKYPCQYSVDRPIRGSLNAWEYYFKQPCETVREQVYKGKRIILLGWKLYKSKQDENILRQWCNLSRSERKDFFEKVMPVNRYLLDEVNKFYDKEIKDRNVLGVFLRGSDYTARKPIGHEVQPTVQQVEEKIDEFLRKYRIGRIFLVTEDADIFQYLKDRYGEAIFCSDYYFVRFDASKDKWVKDAFNNDPYERGKNYLIRIMLLARCKYYVGSKASGSRFALDFSNYEDEYIFELGVY